MKLKLKDLKEIKNEEMRNVKIIKELHFKKRQRPSYWKINFKNIIFHTSLLSQLRQKA